jgi:hypothetical protein
MDYDDYLNSLNDSGPEPSPAPAQKTEKDESVGGIFSRFMDGAQDFGGRFVEGVMDPVYGASQFLENSVEEFAPGAVDAVGNADAWLHDKTGGVLGKPAGVDVDEQLQLREDAYNEKYDVDGTDWARLGGNVATGVALAPAAIGSSLPATAMALAAEGAAGGAFMPQLGEGDYWDQVQSDALLGAAGGAIGGTALNAGGKALTNQLNRAGMQTLKEAGVQPTVGQALGGVADTIEQKVTSIPLVGDVVSHARGRAQGELREATINRVGSKLGVSIEETGMEGLEAAQRAVSSAYDDAAKLLPSMSISDELADGLQGTLRNLETSDVSEGTLRGINKFYEWNIKPRIDGGQMDAKALQALDAEFSQAMKNGSFEYKAALGEMREMITDSAATQSPAYGRASAKARDAFRDLAVIERASAKAENFTPAQLNQAIRANDTSARKGAFAAGKGPLRDLGRAGQDVLGNTVGDSGTAGRNVVNALVGLGFGGGAVATGSVVPLLAAGAAGAAGGTRVGQKATIGLLDMLAKGGAAVGREGRAAGGLLSYLGDD